MRQFAGEGYRWVHLSSAVHPPWEEDSDGQHPRAPADETSRWFAERLDSTGLHEEHLRLSELQKQGVYSGQEKSNLHALFILCRAVKRSFRERGHEGSNPCMES